MERTATGNLFFERPILNSPYEYPKRHWELDKAKIVITNYHAFIPRERMELSKGGRSLLQGTGAPLQTLETEGQVLQRVMPELMGLRNVIAINDEAHHCYREKPDGEAKLSANEKKEAEEHNKAARVWISGLESVNRKVGLARVFDLFGNADQLDPLSIPEELQTALEALYGHYRKTFDLWEAAGIGGTSMSGGEGTLVGALKNSSFPLFHTTE
jgi:hypothetical protein